MAPDDEGILMFKTTLYLDAQTRQALRSLAAHEGRTQTSVLREAVARYAKFAGVEALEGQLPPGLDAYRSGDASLAANTRATVRRAAAARGLRRGA
jgi:predicted transcriptional regulator